MKRNVAEADADIAIKKMILIADSGATKTDWCYGTANGACIRVQTEGINPFHQSAGHIRHILESQLAPRCAMPAEACTEVFFYGAGCLPSVSGPVAEALHRLFPEAHVEVETDLLGAARALCQYRPGIACILGTGSNSCLYDGERITQNVSPLGYILGDEGSGAYLGKHFVADCLKGQLPAHLKDALLEDLQTDAAGIIERVYRHPQANRFLASLCPFIHRHKADPCVHTFLLQCFDDFFRRNVLHYSEQLPVSFAGSIAWHFRTEIEEAARIRGLQTGVFLQSPIEKLAEYHFKAEQ